MKTTVIIEGTHCKSCKYLIEDVSREIAGVRSCNLDLETGEMTIEHNELFDINKLKAEIEELGGYTVKLNP